MKIEIIGRPNCKFCEQSKILAHMKGVEFNYLVLDVDVSRETVTQAVGHEFRTVPQIFDIEAGCYIGGYEELVKYLNEQE